MLYHLLIDLFPGIQNITFRAAFAAVTAFLVSILLGPVIIQWLKQSQVKERTDKVHSDRLATMHRSKQETPSMGGLFLVGGTVLGILLFTDISHPLVILSLFVILSLWILGFVDDWIKLFHDRSHGLSMGTKFIFQCFIGLAAGIILYLYWEESNKALVSLYLPIAGEYADIAWIFPAFVMLVIVSTANAVNLADGLDGLAIGLAVMIALVYAVIAYVTGRTDFTNYLQLEFVRGAGEIAILLTALVGGGIGFLWYNCHPAEIFMGNTGSLPVGGAIGIAAVISKQELLLLLTGAVFVAEALSVGLQVIYFKLFEKRIFRIAPIHHHFEFEFSDREEWQDEDIEAKVVVRFWIASTICGILSLALLTI